MSAKPNLVPLGQQSAASWPEHDCYLWNHQITHITPEYISEECGVCHRITGFMWRKWSKRIRSLFTPEPSRSTMPKD